MRAVSAVLVTVCAILASASGTELRLTSEPPVDTIRAGDSLCFTVQVFVDSVLPGGETISVERPELAEQATWRIEGPPDPLNPGLRNGAGPSAANTFYGRRAYQSYSIVAAVAVSGSLTCADTVNVWVKPWRPDHLVLEASDDSTGKLWNDTPLDVLILAPGEMTNEGFYAIVRDEYQNWIRPSDPFDWFYREDVVTVEFGIHTDRGQGRITRLSGSGDLTALAVLKFYGDTGYSAAMMDDMYVLLLETYYSDIRVGTIAQNGQFNTVTHVEAEAPFDTVLWAQGKRADNGEWEYFHALWTMDIPAEEREWELRDSLRVSFEQPGSGRVHATLPSGPNGAVVSTELTITVTPPIPRTLALYRITAGSTVALPLADTVTVREGDTLRLAARLFDRNAARLSDYETVDSLRDKFVWEAGNATLVPPSNNEGYVVPTIAEGVCLVTASYPAAHATLVDTLVVMVERRVQDAVLASRTSIRDSELRVGNQRIAVPAGARLARVDMFDMRGRRMGSRVLDLTISSHHADPLTERAAGCGVIQVRFDGPGVVPSAETRRLTYGYR